MNLGSRRLIHEAAAGAVAAICAIVVAIAAIFIVPDQLWSSKVFLFLTFTAGVFISACVSLGLAIRLRAVQKRLMILLGIHILIGLPIVLSLPPSGKTRLWVLMWLLLIESSVVSRIAEHG
jgi:hypothetical protein